MLAIVIYYAARYSYTVILEKDKLIYLSNKKRWKSSEEINAMDIQLFEIVYLADDPSVDYYSIYVKDREMIEIGGGIIQPENISFFCSENNIPTSTATVSLKEFDVLLKRQQLIIKYYGKKNKNSIIKTKDIKYIELIILHPISSTLNRYKVHTVNGNVYEFDYYLINRELFEVYAQKSGFKIIEKRLYN